MVDFFLTCKEKKEIFIENNKSFNFCAEKESNFLLNNVIFKSVNNEEIVNIKGIIKEGASFKYVIADFSNSNIFLNIDINLIGCNSKADIIIFSLSSNNSKKKIDVFLKHNNNNIKTNIINYGIVFDNSNLEFNNICEVAKNSKNNYVKQKGKITIFGENASGIIKPVLKISENEVSAFHSAAIGYFNNDHFFYLMSKGLDDKTIKKIVIKCFLNEIFVFFDEKINKKIMSIFKNNKYV